MDKVVSGYQRPLTDSKLFVVALIVGSLILGVVFGFLAEQASQPSPQTEQLDTS